MASRRIPQEIYDEILANLREDTASLRNCSLVCHAWLPRTRHHLFHSIVLDPSSRSRRFKTLVRSCPDIAPLVRVLELRGRAWARRGWWDPENGLPANLMWPTLPGMPNHASRRESDVQETLSWLRDTFGPTPSFSSSSSDCESHEPARSVALINVRSLRLDEVTFNADTAAVLAAAFPRLESLALSGCRAMAFASLADLLRSFPRLRTLRLLSAEWLPLPPSSSSSQSQAEYHPSHDDADSSTTTHTSASASDASPMTLTGGPRLSHLEFTRDVFVQPVLEWLVEAGAHKTVRSLRCSVATQTSANALRAFLRASGPMLERLSMTLSESRDPTCECGLCVKRDFILDWVYRCLAHTLLRSDLGVHTVRPLSVHEA